MYVRMMLLMLISFYTSRVVLHALGAENFGLYNVIGSIVVLFTFVNAAMTTGTQRHLSYELGFLNGNISKIFSACFNIHLWLAILIVLLSETVGLWFVNTKLNFPEGRLEVANWVYQLSIVACVFNIIRVPYNALIVAQERMSFYAYIGFVEGLLKLLIVYLLSLAPFERLITYSILMAIVIGTITFFYFIYCRRQFKNVRYILVNDISLYKGLLGFSGWTLFGSFANLARNQGISFIINIFYGVTLNAAVGIANQVNAGVAQFLTGFQQAFNPQLTKAEATKNREEQFDIICKTAKFSYMLLFFVSLPVLYNLNYILKLWLGDYPVYTSEICLWIIIATLIDSISGPLWVSVFAIGKIKSYQIIISIVMMLILPVSFFCGKLGWEPQYIYAFLAFLNFIAIIIRLWYLNKLIQFNIVSFIKRVVLPVIITTLSTLLLVLFCSFFVHEITSPTEFLLQSMIIILYELVVISLIGLTKLERKSFIRIIKSKFTYKYHCQR